MYQKSFLPSRSVAFLLATFVCWQTATELKAQSGPSVIRVEEDWELYIGEPDTNSNGPQVSCTFSPVNHVSGLHAVFELNHQSLPAFVAGGLQLQIWEGETPSESRKFPSGAIMSTNDECVKWTQTMQTQGNVLTFEIVNGQSTTWGSFGGQGFLKHSVTSGVQNLNDYSPEISVANSGAGFAGNRVKLLVLRKVRYKLSNGQVIEDDTVRIAHPTE